MPQTIVLDEMQSTRIDGTPLTVVRARDGRLIAKVGCEDEYRLLESPDEVETAAKILAARLDERDRERREATDASRTAG